MVDQGVTVEPKPVFLYFDPHPVHKKMASFVGAELVECSTKGAVERIRTGASHDYGDRPLILEGGVPLLEGAVTKLLGDSGPVIALGADSTYDDIVDPLPTRTKRSRYAHRASLRFVDGTLAVSERIATLAERFSGGPVRITHPFVNESRYEQLRSVEPDLDSNRILCVGKYRKKNGQHLLRAAVDRLDIDVSVDFVGADTESIPESERVTTHGFVPESTLIDLFENAALTVFPAPVGAFPVATLESLCAGLPVIVTPRIGTSTLVRGIDARLVADPTPDDIARAIQWYFAALVQKKRQLVERTRGLGSGFREYEGLKSFGLAFTRLLEDLGFEGTIHD